MSWPEVVRQRNTDDASYSARFCEFCGTLLDLAGPGAARCEVCHVDNEVDNDETRTFITTKHYISRFTNDSEMKKAAGGAGAGGDGASIKPVAAIVDQVCEKCGHDKMYFKTAQVRSVDEGQTVYYECIKCKYTFFLNN